MGYFLIVAVVISGCSNSDSGSGGETASSSTKIVEAKKTEEAKKPEEEKADFQSPNFLIKNNLEIENIEESYKKDGKKVEITSSKISGLKNKKVEEKINRQILKSVERFKIRPIPPYRGVQLFFDQAKDWESQEIFVTICNNTSNILSLSVRNIVGYNRSLEFCRRVVDSVDHVKLDVNGFGFAVSKDEFSYLNSDMIMEFSYDEFDDENIALFQE